MGVSLWGAFAAPFLAQAVPVETAIMPPTVETAEPASLDAFSDIAPMASGDMADAAGGTDTAVSIDLLGVNSSDQNGQVAGVVVNGVTGAVSGNSITNNSGFTTVFSNTGNGVVFQNTVNVNIFLGSGASN